jgi:hypothetical protein
MTVTVGLGMKQEYPRGRLIPRTPRIGDHEPRVLQLATRSGLPVDVGSYLLFEGDTCSPVWRFFTLRSEARADRRSRD